MRDRTIQLSWRQRVQIMLDVALAVAYLHSRSVVHRDLKASNVLITAECAAAALVLSTARADPPAARQPAGCGAKLRTSA